MNIVPMLVKILKAIFTVIETAVIFIFLTIYYSLRACIPLSLLPRKHVNGQIVLITGAGGGLGRALAERFANLGARLVLVDVNSNTNEETAKLIKNMGYNEVYTFTCDVGIADSVNRMAELVKAKVGNVDVLINNAGILTPNGLFECSDALIQKTMDVNATAFFWMLKNFLPHMVENNSGHIACIASGTALFGLAGLMQYSSSKGAMVIAFQSLCQELTKLRRDGVKATIICPSFIDTGMFHSANASTHWLTMPLLKPNYVADKTVQAILTNQTQLYLPKIVYLLYMLQGFLPSPALIYMGDKLGILDSMDHFSAQSRKMI